MFWNLILAHFVGDFVLQTDWMVLNRHKPWMLSLHGAIHFLLMALLAGQARRTVWPFLLVFALLHVGQDIGKRRLTVKWPDRTVPLFVLDQALHIALIGLAARWLSPSTRLLPLTPEPTWASIAVAYLFATYVWFVSERVFNLGNSDYVSNINDTKFSRMLVRASLLSLFLLLRSADLPLLAAILMLPYSEAKYRQRAMLTDLGVSLVSILFLWLVLR